MWPRKELPSAVLLTGALVTGALGEERMTNPRLSVIVVCINNDRVLEQCLAALVPQMASQDVEVLAIGHHDDGPNGRAVRSRYPAVVWVSAPNDFTVPRMRSSAMNQSHGEIVALLEDDCVVASNWCKEVVRAHQASFMAIGGPVEPGGTYRPWDWAIYFCEYGRFMAPFSGVVSALSGNNVSYKRAVLTDVQDDRGFYEVFFHWRLQQRGHALYAQPNLAVRNVNHWSLAHLTAIPFHHGRAFAGLRAAGLPRWRRFLYAALSGGLPVVKVARVAQEVFRRRRNGRNFLRSLHWTVLFMLSWSLGEFSGYLAGAGGSPNRWR